MGKGAAGAGSLSPGGERSALLVIAAAFFIGGVAGFALSAQVSGAAEEGLRTYLLAFLDAERDGGVSPPAFGRLFRQLFQWPVVTAVLGLTAAGVWAIPALFAARGFLFSFAAASFVRVLGGGGGLLAFLLLGFSGAVALPVLFLLGVQGFSASYTLSAGRRQGRCGAAVPGKPYFLRCGLCALAFLGCAVLERMVVPVLAGLLPALLPG